MTEQEFTSEVEQHRESLVSYAKALLGSSSDSEVEDVVQDALLGVWENNRYRGKLGVGFRQYLKRVVARRVMDDLRRRYKSTASAYANMQPTVTPGPNAQDPVRDLVKVLEHLPKRDQTLLVELFEGRSILEIAKEVGVDRTWIDRLVRRARRKAQRYLGGYAS